MTTRRRIIPDIVRKQDVATIGGNATVREAVRIMARRNIGSILIVEDSVVHGIFTERDLMRRVVGRDLDPDTTPIAQVMTIDPVTIGADQTAAQAILKMREGGFRHLPVLDGDGGVSAVLSQRDFLHVDLREADYVIDCETTVWESL